MFTNLFYFHTLNSIGGIETFFYQLGKKYGKDFDITVFYRFADQTQLQRLSKYVKCKKYRDGKVIRCKRAFVCFNTDILDFIEADEYYQMLHGDYTSLGVWPDIHPKIQKYISVSEVVRDAYRKGTGDDSIVCYNPFTVEKPKKVLNLVSATRLTADKGFARMEMLAYELDKAGIPFVWTVYTDSNRAVTNPNIIFRPPRLDVLPFIANADYYVQLSDAEGYCYSIVEALSVGTPVIATDFKVIHEIGVINGVNGWIVPMNMENLPIDDIYKGLKKFKYTPLPDRWGELLLPSDEDFLAQLDEIVSVKSKKYYYDLQLNRMVNCNEEWQCTRRRADELENLDLVEIME